MNPREMITRLQLTAVKARSNAAELDLGGDANLVRAEALDPLCYGEHSLSMIGLTDKILAGTPTAMDVFNLLTLIDLKSPSMKAMYYARWEEQLPEAMTYLQENLK